MSDKNRFADVIASRMYYSMFLLVKCSMVYNQENNVDCDAMMKMSPDASTQEHKLAKKCISYLNHDIGMEFSDLYDLRITADYDIAHVDNTELEDAYNCWKQRHQDWVNNLQSANPRLIL